MSSASSGAELVVRTVGAEVRALLALIRDVVAALPELLLRPRRWRRVFEEAATGTKTVLVSSTAVVLVALMLVVEFSFHMRLVLGQDSLVPAFSTTMLIRELVPVVVAIVFAARVGASVAAEVATMKSAEQIDALRVNGVDPMRWLAMPVVVAAVLVTTGLVAVGLLAALAATVFLASAKMGRNWQDYASHMFLFTTPYDILVALGKGAMFGGLVSVCALYAGFGAADGSRGVGRAATRAMVLATASVIAADFLITAVAFR